MNNPPSLNFAINNKKVVLKAAFSSNCLNFVHSNPGSLKPHLSEIANLVADSNIHILAISETWFTSSHNENQLNISGYKLFRHDRSTIEKENP